MNADLQSEILGQVVDLLRRGGVKVESPSDVENFFGNVSHQNLVATGRFQKPSVNNNTYIGKQIDGALLVIRVNGESSKIGATGSTPKQLAFDILQYEYGENFALTWHNEFRVDVVEKLSLSGFTLTSAEIEVWRKQP